MKTFQIIVTVFVTVLVGASTGIPVDKVTAKIQAAAVQLSQEEVGPNELSPDAPVLQNAKNEVKTSIFQLTQAKPDQLNKAEAIQLYLADASQLNAGDTEEALKEKCGPEMEAECVKQIDDEFDKEALALEQIIFHSKFFKDEAAEFGEMEDLQINQAVAQKKQTEPQQINKEDVDHAKAQSVPQSAAEPEATKSAHLNQKAVALEGPPPECAEGCSPCPNPHDKNNCCCGRPARIF
ncbi:hypothetical protein Ocin01_12522 [Orchesella cincta]|uniref:Uncharacterized protein n=1 Tax=Orchesella cincta TaxID=48709 RepID=A0A1D2MMB5_ORCCI|nr:hypothetical protein Ocin01_12522 [Orchesella cincta]